MTRDRTVKGGISASRQLFASEALGAIAISCKERKGDSDGALSNFNSLNSQECHRRRLMRQAHTRVGLGFCFFLLTGGLIFGRLDFARHDFLSLNLFGILGQVFLGGSRRSDVQKLQKFRPLLPIERTLSHHIRKLQFARHVSKSGHRVLEGIIQANLC